MTEETRCSLAASDKGSYHREWPSEPSNYEESTGASRQSILRTEERGLLNVWTDFNRNSLRVVCERKLRGNVQHLLLLQFDGIHCSTSV